VKAVSKRKLKVTECTGAKIGATLNVRRPARFIGTTGPALNVEDFNETSVPVTLTTQFHVDTQLSRVFH
jgi:hypothetical protein